MQDKHLLDLSPLTDGYSALSSFLNKHAYINYNSHYLLLVIISM